MWKKKDKKEKLCFLPPAAIRPKLCPTRQLGSDADLEGLCESIGRFGIIEPLCVRRRGGEYELVCGERRLSAAKILELDRVPCRVLKLSDRTASELSLVENLHRKAPLPFEEACCAQRLLRLFPYRHGELADRLGISPSDLSAKLRLLRFTPEERELIFDGNLSPAHADALLHLRDPAMRLFAIHYMIERALPPAQAEELCLTLATHPEEFIPSLRPDARAPMRRIVLKDVRLFVNSVDRAIGSIREAGFQVEARKEEEDTHISYSIRVPKAK